MKAEFKGTIVGIGLSLSLLAWGFSIKEYDERAKNKDFYNLPKKEVQEPLACGRPFNIS